LSVGHQPLPDGLLALPEAFDLGAEVWLVVEP
jgi:hypothetical protein